MAVASIEDLSFMKQFGTEAAQKRLKLKAERVEEFLAILSETDTAGGAIFAEKVRKHVQKARFMYKGKRIEVTVSSGVSEREKHVSLKAALNSADEYLYQAKENGRNQVGYKK